MEPIELRDGRRICFYAAVFDRETMVEDFIPATRERKKFREVVRPGAFAASLKTADEITANIDHKERMTFASRNAGDLILTEDKKGLFATAWIPETQLGDKIIQDIEHGRLKGCSFKSRIIDGGDVWEGDLCQVVNAPLIDVCITATPYYEDTSLARMRSERLALLFRRARILRLRD